MCTRWTQVKKFDYVFTPQSFIEQKILIFLPKPKIWVRLTVANVRAVKNAVQLHENVVQNYIVY